MEGSVPASRKEREAAARVRAVEERAAHERAVAARNAGLASELRRVVSDRDEEIEATASSRVKRRGFASCLPSDWRGSGTAASSSPVFEMQARALKELLADEHPLFWAHVLHDTELRRFLDSFLRFCPRAFDESFVPFASDKSSLSDCAQVFKRVLLVLARASVARESKDYFLEPSFFEAWVKSPSCWFDAPALMDICVLYMDANRKLVQGIVQNIASINGNKLVPEWKQIASVFVKTCEKAFSGPIDAAKGDAELFLLDGLCNLLAFLTVYPKAAKHFQTGANVIGFTARVFGTWAPTRISNGMRRERVKRLCVAVGFILLDQVYLSRVFEAGTNKYQATIGSELLTLLKDLDCAESDFMSVMEETHEVSERFKKLLASGNGLPRDQMEKLIEQLRKNTRAAPVAVAEVRGGSQKSSQVLEVFPDLGVAFVDACLQIMDNNAEKVINALLTHELPPEIAALDRKTGKPVAVPPAVVSGKGKEEFEEEVVLKTPIVFEVQSCLMEEIAEERAPAPTSMAGTLLYGKRVVLEEQEPIDADLRARVTSYAMYEDEMDDSFLVHADVAMEKLDIDEAEDLTRQIHPVSVTTGEEDGVEAKATDPAKPNSKPTNAKHQQEKNKATRDRRKKQAMKKTGILNVASK